MTRRPGQAQCRKVRRRAASARRRERSASLDQPARPRSNRGWFRREESQAYREELRADLAPLRAQRHANADLARALRDGVTQHAVGSNGRQEQRDAGKNSGEQRRRATRDEALRDARIMERMLSNASSGCAARTSFRSVSANASGFWLVRVTTKILALPR